MVRDGQVWSGMVRYIPAAADIGFVVIYEYQMSVLQKC